LFETYQHTFAFSARTFLDISVSLLMSYKNCKTRTKNYSTASSLNTSCTNYAKSTK